MRTVTERLSKTALLLMAVLSMVAATAAGVGAEPPAHAQNEQAPPAHAQNEQAPPAHAQNEQAPPAHAQDERATQPRPPQPAKNGDAGADAVETDDDEVTLCHATGSETNPFAETTVSVNAVTSEGHSSHHDGGDIIPPFEGFPGQNWDAEGQAIHAAGCSSDAGPDDVERDNEKVTLCHATASETNPFVEITVSVNAVTKEGHSSHQDGRDIIPPFEGFAGQNWDAEGQAIFAAGCDLDDDDDDGNGDDGNGNGDDGNGNGDDGDGDVDETVVEGDEVVNLPSIGGDLLPRQPLAQPVVQSTVEETAVAGETAVLGVSVTRGALARTGSSSVATLALFGLALMLFGFALRRSARRAAAR